MGQHRNPSGATLSVVVPATDSPATLESCLDALRSSARPPDEVIAVTDPNGGGPARARNEGSRRAAGDLIVFVDADVVVHPDALGRIEAALTDGADAVFGAYDDAPPASGVVSRFRNLLHHHVHSTSAGEAETFWAGLGGIRAGAFEEAGGFDERFTRPSVEDVELGIRLRGEGARIVLDPSIRGTHLKRWTLRGMILTDLRDRGIPWSRMLLRSGARPRTLNLGWAHRLTALAAAGTVGALLARRPVRAGAALVAIVALHPRFYALLWRRGGPRLAAAGAFLHCVHSLSAAAAFGLAVAERALVRDPGDGGSR